MSAINLLNNTKLYKLIPSNILTLILKQNKETYFVSSFNTLSFLMTSNYTNNCNSNDSSNCSYNNINII